ncbi:MAG: hypothetical protein WC584_04590 [Candidatus Pacearchaeota archaeon]
MLNLLNRISERFLLFLAIKTDTLKIINKEFLERDLEFISRIVFSPEFDRTPEEKEFMEKMKIKYRWGNYNQWNPIYKNGLKSLKQEYKTLHQNICYLLYD